MTGFWKNDVPVTADSESVKATVYLHPGRALLSIGNFSDTTAAVALAIDWKALGLDPAKARLSAPEINHFQKAHTWSPGDTITIGPRRGYLIYLEQ